VMIFEASGGKQIGEYRSEAADFYVTNAWLKGDRLFYFTDAGVLFDGVLEPEQ
jgi:hypothetical protein